MLVIASLMLTVAQIGWCEDNLRTLKLFRGWSIRRRRLCEYSTSGKVRLRRSLYSMANETTLNASVMAVAMAPGESVVAESILHQQAEDNNHYH
jgi:hypothetical protein